MKKSTIDRTISFVLIIIAGAISLFHKSFLTQTFWIYVAILIWFIGAGFLFKAIFINVDEKVNLFIGWRYLHNYFTGIGISIVAGSLVVLFTVPEKYPISIGLIVSGTISLIFGAYFLAILEKTKDEIHLGSLRKSRKNKK